MLGTHFNAVAAAIEQSNDKGGIVWPISIAPYQVCILPMNMHKSERLREAVESLYAALSATGVEVLLDDRAIRPGVMFADADLPLRGGCSDNVTAAA